MSALDLSALVWIGFAIVSFVSLLRVPAPYGRHARPGWGRTVPAAAGWIAMESISLVVMASFLATARPAPGLVSLLLACAWIVHYLHRSFIYPMRARMRGRTMPLSVVLMAMVFNAVNAGLNGAWLFFAAGREPSWLEDPRFVSGALLFAAGFVLNVHSDSILFSMRRPGETGYRIPTGGPFRYVSCPNYLGEIVQWCGFALAAWSLPALSFAVWTSANLVPRALAHHRWYHAAFPDYPPGRRALIPYVV